MKRVTKLRELSIEELEEKVLEAKKELAKEKASIASGTKAEKPSKIKNLRREIARMLTIINEKKRMVKSK
ncbi:MAG: 50S ribosomal protein L29 [Candidatus Diapherotrites archaeon]|nr:50S ribosomal protein L29 [Candidatus Diapherotrites archaeon]